MTAARELNLDGLPGPTHNHAGLAPGNLASQTHKHQCSSPRAAALQGLAKMKLLADLGVPQAVLPPHPRPDLALLRRTGFTGDDAALLARAAHEAPEMLAAVCSASSMWAANAATVCPSIDSHDGRAHFTPANLVQELHRSLEPAVNAALLRGIFPDPTRFVHHAPLPASLPLRDEGAANHTRLCRAHGEPGVHLFVYGMKGVGDAGPAPRRHPARQSLEASAAIARLHTLEPDRVIFARQHPDAIDAGVFHNDVAAVGDCDLLFYHRRAFVEPNAVLDRLHHAFARTCGGELRTIEVADDEVPLDEAVGSYLFNSQLVQCRDGSRAIILPRQCADSAIVRDYITSLVGPHKPITHAYHVDLAQSMRNGGGPACLRLRVALTEDELAAVHAGVMLDDALYDALVRWIERHYRETLAPADLADPALLAESRTAHAELDALLGLSVEKHSA